MYVVRKDGEVIWGGRRDRGGYRKVSGCVREASAAALIPLQDAATGQRRRAVLSRGDGGRGRAWLGRAGQGGAGLGQVRVRDCEVQV